MTVYVALDTETTGLEPGSRLIEIAAIVFTEDGTVLSEFDRLVHPGMPIPSDSETVHGISDAEVAHAPSAAVVLRDFEQWVPHDAVWVAHNAAFDVGILGYEYSRAQMPLPAVRVIDSKIIAKRLGETASNALQALVRHHGWELRGPAHRALPDADAVRQLMAHAFNANLPDRAFRGRPIQQAHAYPHTLPVGMEVLPDAVASGRPIYLRYQNADGWVSERCLTPYGYAERNGRVAFHGHCHSFAARRSFRSDRVLSLSAAVE